MNRTLILLYHRVAQSPVDPFGLCVAPNRFLAQVDYLARRRSVVDLLETQQPASSDRVAITFDDGYLDNARVAAPALSALDLPATWFITVGRLGGQRFWWDRLAEALLGPHDVPKGLDAPIPGQPAWVDLRTVPARHRALSLLHRRIRPLPSERIEPLVSMIVDRLGAPTPGDDARSMTADELRQLAATPGMDIGAHTLTHVQLRGQVSEVKRREVLGSIQGLRTLLGKPVSSFAYPFGSPRAVDREAERLVRQGGCELACSTDLGLCKPGRRKYRLPRMSVGDWPVDEFALRVEAAFAGHFT